MVKEGEKECFSDFLQRLTTAVQIKVTNSEARHALIESLAFENANIECKKTLGPLKARSKPIYEWILHTMNVEIFDYITECWIGEAISNGMRRHQNAKSFNCGKIGHLRREYRQKILGTMSSLGMKRIGGLSLLVYVGGVTKADIGPMNVGQQKTDKAT